MRFFKTEIGAIVLWLIASLLGAALLTPYLYDAGKTLAENASTADYPSVIESIASSAERAKPDRYFSRCLLFSAIVLLPFLIRRVRSIPPRPGSDCYALKKLSWSQRLLHLSSGIIVGASVLGILAVILNVTGASFSEGASIPAGKFFTKAFLPALGAGVIEELVFRGLILGLWLRACVLWKAWLGSAFLFSFVHFLKPPDGMVIADPRAWHSGFEILSSTLGHFTNPEFFVTEFATLTLLGLILAYCRTKTSSLWLPIGLHAGLVFALKTFSMTQDLDPNSPLHPWFIGGDLKSGIFPLLSLALCFVICVFLVRKLSPASR
ncbi:lysostaphin resistance A-like protein [Luteolibacter sp. AS25]|uniref:CPBP family intramembrane glutamic endopeptidase n=1 Tax=Luteolibacter sp. AS25 TaxID=3135776 RepID=UPI00398AE78C